MQCELCSVRCNSDCRDSVGIFVILPLHLSEHPVYSLPLKHQTTLGYFHYLNYQKTLGYFNYLNYQKTLDNFNYLNYQKTLGYLNYLNYLTTTALLTLSSIRQHCVVRTHYS